MRFSILLPALLVSCAPAFGQSAYGRITGRVTDSLDAVVAGVSVRAVQLETNIVTPAATNEVGSFDLLNLIPGNYRIVAEKEGFKRYERSPVEVRVGDVVSLTVSLELGAISESVTVTAEAPMLESATASMGQVVDNKQITDLPLPGGSVTYLMQLSPGIVSLNAPTHGWLPQARDSTSNLVVSGTTGRSSEFQIDGAPNMAQDGILAFMPPPEMVQEFRIQSAAFDAAVGRFTGAQVNMVMKNGTNQLHGTAWFSHLSRPLMTHPFFINRSLYDLSTGPVTPEKRNGLWPATKTNRYRVTVGGPVYLPKVYDGRNRTFFSYGNDFMLRIFAGQGFQTVPTERQRRGDFSELLALSGQYQLYDPYSAAAISGGRIERRPLAGNVVPASRLDPLAQKLLAYWPMPNRAGTADFRNNYQNPPANRIDYKSHVLRMDQVLSDKHRLFGTLTIMNNRGRQGNQFRNISRGTVNEAAQRGFVFDDVYTLRPNLLLNLRYGLTRIRSSSDPTSTGFNLAELGWPAALLSKMDTSLTTLPIIDVDGYTPLVDELLTRNATTNHFVGGTATYIRGSHSVRIGGEFRVLLENNQNYGSYTPTINFANTWLRGPLNTSPVAPIGQGLASFLYGLPTGGFVDRYTSFAQASKYLSGFVHDDWKVTRKLTLNLGLRYEVEFPTTERYNRANRGFDFVTPNPVEPQARANYARNPIPELPVEQFRTIGGMTFAGVNGVPRTMWQTDANNYSPRIGAAYQVSPRFVLRAGYGIFFQSLGVDRVNVGQQGFDQRTNMLASPDNGVTFYGTLRDPFPDGILEPKGAEMGLLTFVGRSPSFFDPRRPTGYMQRWSFTVQREFAGRMMIEVGYIGNRGTKLGVGRNLSVTPAQYLSRSPERDQATIDFLSQLFPNPFRGIPEFAGTGLQGVNVSRANLLRPFPHFSDVNTTEWDGFSWYHAGHVRFDRRFSKGFSLQGTYTWSKFMASTDRLNAQDLRTHDAIAAADRPHHIVINGTWQLPFGRGKAVNLTPAWADWVAGGWSLQAIYQWQSGPPIGFGNIIYRGDLADMVLPRGERTVERWFNTDAPFERDPAKQLANNLRTFPLRQTGLRADGWNNWDLSLFKTFRLREGVRLQLRAEAQDALNHAMFNAPNTGVVNTLFGTVNGTIWSEQRKITVAAKLMW